MMFESNFITYEDFGAIGDGIADDLPAIHTAHEHANLHGLSIRTKPDATYHLGARAITVKIATDTDWNTSRFTIDDTQVEDYQIPIFEVCSLLELEKLHLDRIVRDQKKLDVCFELDCYVMIENDQKRRYIRRGLNQNNGKPQNDCFILHRDGTIEGDIDWDYESITSVDARPIDEETLLLSGGVFTTFANSMSNDDGYKYWARNIIINRSNTEVDGITHYVVGETAVGSPYRGFISINKCANITLRNCFVTAHKTYLTIGAAGMPVSMGSYDLNANNVVNFSMINCRMNQITDRTRWGIIGTNFCKNILLEECVLSRMDSHMGVSGSYVIRRCTLGHMGLNAIGRGTLTVEDSTLYGYNLVSFRPDYGSTWDGNLIVRNSKWIPSCGETTTPYMIGANNDGMHDFGYPCSMPREITIDGLFVDDTNHPEDYEGMYFFTNHDDAESADEVIERPFPYEKCQKLTVRGLSTASGRNPHVSPNAGMLDTVLIEEE